MAEGRDPDTPPYDALNTEILSDELSTVSDWYQLGIKLGVPDYKLDEIQRSYPTEGCSRWRVEALSLWLRCTPNSSWKSVVRALQKMGENTLAERIQRKYIKRQSTPTSRNTGHPTAPHVISPTLQAGSQNPVIPAAHQFLQTHSVHPIEEDSGAVAIARENRQKIYWKFGVLLKNSCKKLREKQLNVQDFRLFLKGLFPPGDCVPESSNINEIFEAITRNKLWNHWNCSPLQKVVQEFVGEDQEMKSWIETYKKDLTSYKVTTRLVDYIAVVDSDPSSDDLTSDEEQEQAPAKYDRRYYRKLSIKLEAKFTSHTLEYLDDLWEEFADLYNLPPLVTLLDCVCKSSILIVWLIPAHLAHHILRAAPGSVDIFLKHQITRVEFDGVCIYPEAKQHSEGVKMAQTPFQFQFQNVRINKDKRNRIGIGHKILVYKVECDGLPCAAKMLGSTAMPRTVTEGIKKQFELLGRCQHPNIVQYLGMTTDSETLQPVFLVELMDRNLSQYLVQSQRPLPIHIQMDLCHDIGKALNYLHSNGVIHCNLSSRNILLSGGKAKIDISASFILRDDPECPGRPDYMPPEGFTMQYTCKLDCFSFGVLAVEIITGEDPEPGPRNINLSEIERRRNHIDMIYPKNPLLPIVLECLKDSDTERPSSQELCHRLATLKESHQYIKSVKKAWQQLDEEKEELLKRCGQLAWENQDKGRQLEQANRELQEKSQQLEQANQELQEKDQQLEQANRELQENRQQLAQANHGLHERSQQLEEANQDLQSLSRQLQQLRAAQPQLTSTHVGAWTVPRVEVKILDQIGGGAWGAVAKGMFQNQQVAVKWPYLDIINAQTLERLRREVRIMAQVRHPNLLRFIAAVFDDQTPPLIITELLDLNLRTAYQNGHLQNPNKLPIFLDVAYALHYLHEHEEPIIHRDVSAPYVLLELLPGGIWRAKVSDFGLANLAQSSRTLGEGAVIYTAPETFPILDPHVRRLPQTTKIDIYSYGILLCEVITCQLPDPVKYYDMLQQVKIEWQIIYDLIIRCTRHNPDERPTMLQVLDELNKSPDPPPRQQ